MAGYLILLDESTPAEEIFASGVYSTAVSAPHGKGKARRWLTHHEATLADYLGMRHGDWIFFFTNRRIYGVGQLIAIRGHCAFQNFPGACSPLVDAPSDHDRLLWIPPEESDVSSHRWLCTFVPAPILLPNPVDMDDALSSNPGAFKSLRVIWKRSFIKMDDVESQALVDILARRNQDALEDYQDPVRTPIETHERISRKFSSDHILSASDVLRSCAEGDGAVGHEMAVEAGLVEALTRDDPAVRSVFGSWDYVSHQVHASPFKPVDYMDKIDVFGYRRLRPFGSIGSYLIAEIKKGVATSADVHQLIKYVDWVAHNHCGGDYSLIDAFLVAHSFDSDAASARDRDGVRSFTVGSRPVIAQVWSKLRLVRYEFDLSSSRLEFSPV